MKFNAVIPDVVTDNVEIARANQRVEHHEVATVGKSARRTRYRFEHDLVLGPRPFLPASQASDLQRVEEIIAAEVNGRLNTLFRETARGRRLSTCGRTGNNQDDTLIVDSSTYWAHAANSTR